LTLAPVPTRIAPDKHNDIDVGSENITR